MEFCLLCNTLNSKIVPCEKLTSYIGCLPLSSNYKVSKDSQLKIKKKEKERKKKTVCLNFHFKKALGDFSANEK